MKQNKRWGTATVLLTMMGIIFCWFTIIFHSQQVLETSTNRNILQLDINEQTHPKPLSAEDSTPSKNTRNRVEGLNKGTSLNRVKFVVDVTQAKTPQMTKQNDLVVSNLHLDNDEAPPPTETTHTDISCTNCTRYIVFRPIPHGQGTGQHMNGLLAAHLLGEEFNRVVCVTPTYEPFHMAFEPVHPQEVQDCPTLKLNPKPKLLTLINYNAAPDECKLKQELSSDKQIIYIVGNTYPRYRSVPDKYFSQFYKPTITLKNMLPWKEPPTTVVHLRKADREAVDGRAGLDTKTLTALGEALPSDTFLVTNNVNWFDYFADKFQWSHPNWRGVQHSAFRNFLWGQRAELTEKDRSEQAQHLQMFSDWYSILCAKRVWHTHSDFSLSAIHWMNIESKTIMGVDENGTLKLVDEPWRREEVMPPLVDRGPDQLENCKEPVKSSVV